MPLPSHSPDRFDPVGSLVAAHRGQGLAIDGWTACPQWYGERLDLDRAIDVLHPVANPGAYRRAAPLP
jgi:hypothetical protein